MVDGINSIRQTQKDMSINWQECTAEEIIDYEGQGQDVPTEVLRWAQEMAKITGAPDNITYEMSMSNDEYSVQNAGNKNNVASDLKAGLEANGTSILEQGKIFSTTSAKYESDIGNLESSMEEILANAENNLKQAQEIQNNIISQIQTLQATQQSLKSDKNNIFSALQAAGMDQQIKSIAETGVASINILAENIYNDTNGIDGAIYTADTGNDIGLQTIDIGNQITQMYNLTLGNYGASIQNQGSKTVDKAAEGKGIFEQTADDNSVNITDVNGLKDEIYKTSNKSPATETETESKDDTTQNQEIQQQNQPKEEKANEPKDNTEFNTDPNEILKRKERRGITTT